MGEWGEMAVRVDEKEAVRRWLRGQRAAAARQAELLAVEGARPEVAVGESRSAVNALEETWGWPAGRDPVAEQAVAIVRQRWARVQRRARRARKR